MSSSAIPLCRLGIQLLFIHRGEMMPIYFAHKGNVFHQTEVFPYLRRVMFYHTIIQSWPQGFMSPPDGDTRDEICTNKSMHWFYAHGYTNYQKRFIGYINSMPITFGSYLLFRESRSWLMLKRMNTSPYIRRAQRGYWSLYSTTGTSR